MFDNDPPAQLATMLENLTSCHQTQDAERAAFRAIIDAETRDPLELGDVVRIQSQLRARALGESWFFRGQSRPDLDGKPLISTISETRLEYTCALELQESHPALTPSEAHDISASAISDLQDSIFFGNSRAMYASIFLHQRGSPMWLADPTSVADDPLKEIALLPARLGIAPRPGRHFLMNLTTTSCSIPRFADSGGYPYWRPGGITRPIEQCPAKHVGLAEVVAETVTVERLSEPLQVFERKI